MFGHAIHHPWWRDQDHQPVVEPHSPRLFRADPARIRRGIDRGDKPEADIYTDFASLRRTTFGKSTR